MFTWAMMMSSLDSFPYGCPVSNLRVEKFDLDFEFLDAEDCCTIVRCRPTYSGYLDAHTRPQDFWIRANWERQLKSDLNDFKDYVAIAAFKLITEDEFNEFVRKTWFHLINAKMISIPLHESSGFLGAMLMYNDWYDRGLFVQYEDEYIAIFSTRTS